MNGTVKRTASSVTVTVNSSLAGDISPLKLYAKVTFNADVVIHAYSHARVKSYAQAQNEWDKRKEIIHRDMDHRCLVWGQVCIDAFTRSLMYISSNGELFNILDI